MTIEFSAFSGEQTTVAGTFHGGEQTTVPGTFHGGEQTTVPGTFHGSYGKCPRCGRDNIDCQNGIWHCYECGHEW